MKTYGYLLLSYPQIKLPGMLRDKKPYRILVIEDNPGDLMIVEEFIMKQILSPVIAYAGNF